MPRQLTLPRAHPGRPSRVRLKGSGLARSEHPCVYIRHARTDKALEFDHEERGEACACLHRAFWYTLNHLKVSLCICHARYLSRRHVVRIA